MALFGRAQILGGRQTTATTFDDVMAGFAPTYWWKANEASGNLANYGSGGTADMVPTGSPDYQQTLGSYQAINLDGSTELFEANVSLSNDTAFSMFCMFRSDVLPPGGTSDVIVHSGFGASPAFERGLLLLLVTDGSVYAMCAKGATTGSNREDIQSAASLVTASTNHTIGFVYTGSSVRLFLDGSLVANQSYSGGVSHEDIRWGDERGSDDPAGVDLFDGKMCHLAWWNGTALADADFATLDTASGL